MIDEKISECVGLWLAEGNNKCHNEITFTNNCWELVEYFHTTILELFKDKNLRIRIYVYNSTKEKIRIPIKNIKINNYIDNRATKPYYIWRLASVELMKSWKNTIKQVTQDEKNYAGILRGFFAGEGNIKLGSHSSRAVRISQSKRIPIIETILDFLKLECIFSQHHRSGYMIRRKENFDKMSKYKIADLHPIKRKNFRIC